MALLTGTAGDDLLRDILNENGTLIGEAGHDTLEGLNFSDTLYGGSGDDLLGGGDDFDVLYGGEGADTLSGGSGQDTVFGGNGDDVLSGSVSDDTLEGGAGNDTIYGNKDFDKIQGGGGLMAWATASRTRTSSKGGILLFIARMVSPSVEPTITLKRGSASNCGRFSGAGKA